jgi:hypothetical protein
MGEVLVLVAALSLGWLLVGILAGRQLGPMRGGSGGGGKRRGRAGGSTEIYVGNLPYEVTEKDLARAFGRFGQVDSIRIIKNKFNGKSKGFGFIEMANHPEATEAVRALNGRDFSGRRIVVNEAKSQARSEDEE